MRLDIPRFVEAAPGEIPDAYFLDGALVTPLTRIARVDASTPPFPKGLDGSMVEAFAASAPVLPNEGVLRAIAAVAAVEKNWRPGNRDAVAIADLAPPLREALDRSAKITAAMRRLETE